jgi:hypothetical protein
MQASKSTTRVSRSLSGGLAAIAIMLGASGANGQTPAPAPAPQLYEYAVKFVCGRAGSVQGLLPPVAPGFYFTDINVHNPNSGTIEFKKKFAVAFPNQKAGPVSQFFGAVLKSDEAFSVDCGEITKKLNLPPLNFVTGFAVFQTAREIDVVAVYTTAATQSGTILTMHTERVPKRP